MSRLDALVDALQHFYGRLPAPPQDPFGLFVWEVLSAHTTPRQRDAALAALKRIPALTPDSVFRAPAKKLEEAVALAGGYREQRLQALRNGADQFRRAPDLPKVIRGPAEPARLAATALPQIVEGMASRMLLFAADQPVLPADAPIQRVARRLGYGSVEADLGAEIAPDVEARRRAILYLSHHAAATCTEREPHCGVCPLAAECPEAQRRLAAPVR